MPNKEISLAQALENWENGEEVVTVEMGGLSPAYENAIQDMGWAFTRFMFDNPPIDGWENMKDDYWKGYKEECEAACSDLINNICPSGAQFGAAMNLASVFNRNGYQEGLAMVEESRQIVCRKSYA